MLPAAPRSHVEASPALPMDQADISVPARSQEPVSSKVSARAPEQTPEPAPRAPLSLIVSAPDAGEREQLKKLFLEKDPNTRITLDLPIINGFAVEMDPDSVQVLPELGKAARNVRVYLDDRVSIPEPPEYDGTIPGPETSLDTAVPTLELNKLWEQGITGKGVNVAVIDTGIAQHPDVKSRIIGFKDFVNGKTEAYDDQGHGTHCSSILAGDGQASEGRYKGAAPEASLVGIKVLDKNGSGAFSNVIAGIQYAIENKDKFGISVISMSLGGRISKPYKDDPVAQAVEAAAAAGIVCCVAAGNSGPGAKTVGTPGNAPSALTVGAADDKGTLDRSDDAIASFSSRGPTSFDNLIKPDVVAPGVNIMAADARGGYRSMSGTSMATPMVAGIVAMLRQARPDLDPAQIKDILMANADPLAQGDANTQGKGMVDPHKALDNAPAPPPPPEPPAPPEPPVPPAPPEPQPDPQPAPPPPPEA